MNPLRRPKLGHRGRKPSLRLFLRALALVAGFFVTSVLVAIVSWYDYRKEEVLLLNSIVSPRFRAIPKLRNFWRWSETYHILFVVAFVIVVWIYTSTRILPLFR